MRPVLLMNFVGATQVSMHGWRGDVGELAGKFAQVRVSARAVIAGKFLRSFYVASATYYVRVVATVTGPGRGRGERKQSGMGIS